MARREGDGVGTTCTSGPGTTAKTARIYTTWPFTADQEIGDDIAEMFNYLTGYARPSGYRKVGSPRSSSGWIPVIERTIEAHSAERPARIG